MAKMSIGKAWEEASAFVARERALLLPVALLFIALPAVILQEMTPPELIGLTFAQVQAALPQVPASYWTAMLLTTILLWFGSMTIFGLVLRSGISVGESLRLALARMPILLGATLLLMVAMFFAVIVGGGIAGALATVVPAAAGLFAAAMIGFVVWAGLRCLLLNTVILDKQLGITGSIRHAWRLSRGSVARFAAFFLVGLALSLLASLAAQLVFGTVALLIAGKSVGLFVANLASSVVSTIVLVYMLVMIARLYRQAEDA
ncbi:MAG: hypothetical protein ABW039_05125 [Sphingobium sp.]